MDASHILLALAAGVFGILWYLSIRKVSALRADVASRDEANSTLSRRLFESGTAQQRLEQRLGEARHLCESQERELATLRATRAALSDGVVTGIGTAAKKVAAKPATKPKPAPAAKAPAKKAAKK